ncbi:MAG TPA: ester cyclase [Rubrobacter sp.]|jgi:hypothetical protein|nr:ester cyclase [Rubrobacter sp.]
MALVRRFFEAQGEGDMDTLDEILAEDFVDRSLLPSEDPDREGYKRSVAEDHSAFSELRYIIEDQVGTSCERGTASCSTATGWWRPTTSTARCSARRDSTSSS